MLLLLLLAQDLQIVSDAWPKSPRNVGQKFGMNSRDTIPTQLERGEDDALSSESVAASRGERIRIVGVRVRGPANGTLTSPDVPSIREKVVLRAGETGRWFFTIRERASIRFALGDVTKEAPLNGRTGERSEVVPIVEELRHEQEVQSKFDRAPTTVDVVDEAGQPLTAQVTLIHTATGLIVEGEAKAGRWEGLLLAGEWQALARAVVKPKAVATGETVVAANPRLYYFGTVFKEGPVRLAPNRVVTIDAPGERVVVTPSGFRDILRYATPYARIGPAFALSADVAATLPVTLHASELLPLDVLTFAPGKLAFSGNDKSAALTVDPKLVPGGAERIELAISLPDAPREVFRTRAARIDVPAGPVRVEMTVHFKDSSVRFAPHLVTPKPGAVVDLTPKAWSVTPYYQESRGLMVWLALADDQGKIVAGLDKISGRIVADKLFDVELKDLRLHFPQDFGKTSLGGIVYGVSIPIGTETVKFSGKALPRQVFADGPASVEVPPNLEAKARGMLPMVRKTLAGGLKYLAVPDFALRVAFEIRLPPEVGGLGGGGRIQLDLGEVLEYAHETDALPGAYTHELGHCFGYGHDPYMSMASCGVDEGLYGTRAYLLLNGRSLARAFAYLDRDADAAEWAASADVFAAIRALYGPDAHNRMFELRKRFSNRLDKVGISIPEQMAAYYSEASKGNLAWLFRAYGWPVFDYRVQYAREMLNNQSFASREELPRKIDGSWLTHWWVRGPMPVAGGEAPWKVHKWEGRFLMLAKEKDFLSDAAYHFFLTVESESTKLCYLSIASDAQVACYLNGKRVSRVAAAPQFSQPVHDGYTMERGNATIVPVIFAQGENALEMVVVRPAGSKGMWIELANDEGKPIRSLGTNIKKGPVESDSETVVHAPAAPVFNASFESGLEAWIRGAKDGEGEMAYAVDDAIARDGKKSLRLEAKGPVAGGMIQRLVVEEGAKYEFTGWVHTDGLREKQDRAWIGLFLGEPYGGTVVPTTIVEKNVPGWQKVTFAWTADRRTIYIGCVLKGDAGAKAWYDGIELVRKK